MPRTAEDLAQAFFERENATTHLKYVAAKKDFAAFARAKEPHAALQQLLAGGAVAANDLVARWKRSMVGTRDKKGKLIRGPGAFAGDGESPPMKNDQ